MGNKLDKKIYTGLFLITLATLMLEILLTRIFSVTMWYHYAFLAISVTMFGMTVGAILVYLYPNFFTTEKIKQHLSLSALLFGITTIIGLIIHLNLPFSLKGMFSVKLAICLLLTYILMAIPFIFSGICVSIALSKFPKHVGTLYAVDLIGSAIGCFFVIFILRVTDAPTAIFFVSFVASLSALMFAASVPDKKLIQYSLISILLLAIYITGNTILISKDSPLLRLRLAEHAQNPLYEKWNSFSRVTVIDKPEELSKPFGWGLSKTYIPKDPIKQYFVLIDAAETVLTNFDGDLNKINYLKFDVTNIAHYIRQNAKVLAIGAGGGRDILSALVFNQKSILGVEINNEVINVLTDKFANFTGNLHKYKNVQIVNDEARNYISRSKEKFDIIQISLIDTFAATAAGAFVLAENSLYTKEAWKIFFDHCEPNGVLSISRWMYKDVPDQMYRLTALASDTLLDYGIKDTKNHIVIIKHTPKEQQLGRTGVGTILISLTPFSKSELQILKDISNKLQFEIIFMPDYTVDPAFTKIVTLDKEFLENFPLNITPTTDDSPFFFFMVKLKNLLNPQVWKIGFDENTQAVGILGFLLLIVLVLTIACIDVPLSMTKEKYNFTGAKPLLIFFASIGLGFMFIEISQMQRLIIFLGHPIYSLSVVLFTLLLSSGLGSMLTHLIQEKDFKKWSYLCLITLLLILILFAFFTPITIQSFDQAQILQRIFVSIALLFPLGIFLGMAFPLGLRLASINYSHLTTWLWGINGATSVCASVLAVAIALTFGITITYWCGCLCYLLAVSSFLVANNKK